MIIADTDIMVDVLREYAPAIDWLGRIGDEQILVPGFVCAELIQGCSDKSEQRKVLSFLSGYEVAWPEQGSCGRALDLFCDYYLSHGLGLIDALIAQTALDLAMPLHTFNAKHYQCVPGLELVAPYARPRA